MNLYETIASEYINIFPSSSEKRAFTEELLSCGKAADILDIGCASGEFAFQLARTDRRITGIDSDSHMIDEALRNLDENSREEITFLQEEMLPYLRNAPDDSFDLALCMGNTLVYLEGEKELSEFLREVRRILRDGGLLVIQLLNYSNPLIRPGFTFPPLESSRIRFERTYGESDSESTLEFRTKVTDKVEGTVSLDTHRHSRFTPLQITAASQTAGFSETSIYGGYDRSPCGEDNFFNLAVIRR